MIIIFLKNFLLALEPILYVIVIGIVMKDILVLFGFRTEHTGRNRIKKFLKEKTFKMIGKFFKWICKFISKIYIGVSKFFLRIGMKKPIAQIFSFIVTAILVAIII